MARTLIIAEIGVNHGGRLDHALQLIAEAKRCGADAAKFQAFTPSALRPGDYAGQAMLKGLALTEDELTMLAAECDHVGIEFMCSPMDDYWLRVIEKLGVERIKIGSAQVKNLAFIDAVNRCGLPVILSNGMCTDAALAAAVDALSGASVTIMSCISEYPTSETTPTMSALRALRGDYPGVEVGFSSHCRSFWPTVAAVYAGATVTENHLRLPGCTGPDASSSLLPEEFKALVREVRVAENVR